MVVQCLESKFGKRTPLILGERKDLINLSACSQAGRTVWKGMRHSFLDQVTERIRRI